MHAFAGDPLGVHKEGVRLGKDVMQTTLLERADIVMAGPGYVENEASLFQSATRTFATAENLVKDRRTIILVSSCHKGIYEGTGNEVECFRKWFADLLKPKEIIEMTKRNEVSSFEACVILSVLVGNATQWSHTLASFMSLLSRHPQSRPSDKPCSDR
jgi:nickel-dependent lactate racemase